MKMETFTAAIRREGELYGANRVEVGTVSQGRTMEDALKDLKEATELYLEEFPIENYSPFFITTFSAEHA